MTRRLALLAALACTGWRAAAQERRPLTVDEALSTRSLANRVPVDLSPDGEWVAYTLVDVSRQEPTGDERYKDYTRTGAYRETQGCDVWIANTRTGESRNLTGGHGTSSNPVWSPDGRWLAFYSDRTGTYGLWLWDRDTGAMRELSDVIPRPYFGFAGVRWSADGRRLVLKALPEGMTVEQAASRVASPITPPAREPGSTVTVYESTTQPDSAAAQHPSAYYLADVVVIDVPSGAVRRVARAVHAVGYWIAPDGGRIVFTNHQGLARPNTQQNAYDIVTVSVADGASRVLAPDVLMDYGVSLSWSPDGRSVAYATSGPLARPGELFTVALSGGAAKRVSLGQHPDFGQSVLAPWWDASGRNLYVLAGGALWRTRLSDGTTRVAARIADRSITHAVSEGNNAGRIAVAGNRTVFVTTRAPATKQVGLFKVDLTSGASERIFERDQFLSTPTWTIDVSRDGRTAVYAAQAAREPEDVWVAVGPELRETRRLTHINPRLDSIAFGASRVMSWTTARGDTLRGGLILPSTYEPGRRYPLVVKIYAGSSLSDRVFRFGGYGGGVENMQLLATRGYAVLLPDVRQRLGTPMTDIADAVLPALDRVVALGIADPDRLGVTGQSYGGYSVLSLIVQTTRFKAAISNAGPADLVGIYAKLYADGRANGVGWAEAGQGLMGGSPWEVPERYAKNSPLTFLDHVETPLLLIHGGIDRNVPVWESEAVFVGLRRLGKEVVYARYEGEDHWEGTWGRANAVDYWNRVFQWFDSHLKSP